MRSIPIRFEKQYGRFRIIWFRTEPALCLHFPLYKGATRFVQIGKLRLWRDGGAKKK